MSDDLSRPTPLASYVSTAPNFSFGGHDFTPEGVVGRLDLFDKEAVDAFDAELAALGVRAPNCRGMVRKLSVQAAEEMAIAYLADLLPAARNGVVDSATAKAIELEAAAQQKPTPFQPTPVASA